VEKSSPKILGAFSHYQETTQIKQSPTRRKFAPSGHPGSEEARIGNKHLESLQRTKSQTQFELENIISKHRFKTRS
jgi:hypothetical protein